LHLPSLGSLGTTMPVPLGPLQGKTYNSSQ
jgi:hypothetical protein